MTVEAAIIGVLGTGLLGMLGFFLQAIRSDIRALGERLDGHEEILVEVRERLAAIEAIQAEHSRLLGTHDGPWRADRRARGRSRGR